MELPLHLVSHLQLGRLAVPVAWPNLSRALHRALHPVLALEALLLPLALQVQQALLLPWVQQARRVLQWQV